MKSRILILLVVTSILIVSCSTSEPMQIDSLSGTEWRLKFIRKSTPLPESTITISFAEGEVRGNAGCNSYFGTYNLEGQMIKIDQLAMTEMACMDPAGIMEQEQEYFAFLSEVVSYSIVDNELYLKKEHQDQLTFEMSPSS